MTDFSRRALLMHSAVATSLAFAAPAFAQEKPMTHLFKIITVRDEIVIGLDVDEMQAIGGADAGTLASTLRHRGTLAVWQYATRKAPNGDLEQAPLRKVGLMAHDTVRVEPYATALAVQPHQ